MGVPVPNGDERRRRTVRRGQRSGMGEAREDGGGAAMRRTRGGRQARSRGTDSAPDRCRGHQVLLLHGSELPAATCGVCLSTRSRSSPAKRSPKSGTRRPSVTQSRVPSSPNLKKIHPDRLLNAQIRIEDGATALAMPDICPATCSPIRTGRTAYGESRSVGAGRGSSGGEPGSRCRDAASAGRRSPSAADSFSARPC